MDRPLVETDPRRIPRRRVAALVLGALGLALVTIEGRGRELDDRMFGFANGRLHNRALDLFFRGLTELGSMYASVAAAGTIALRGRRREALDALGAAMAMWGVGQSLKNLFRRARPYEAKLPRPLRLLIGKPVGSSWPSVHPATLLAFLTVVGRDLELSRGVRRGLAGAAATVAASRVYLGVHYPADVLGGLLLGRAVADLWTRVVSPRVLGR